MLLVQPNEKMDFRVQAMAEIELRKRVGGSFENFVNHVKKGKYEWYRHCKVLANTLEKVLSGEIKRLMVFMPPRHGKSELASRLFPAYTLYKRETIQIGLTSYSGDLAHSLSRYARDNYEISGKVLRNDAAATREWYTLTNGVMWAAGVGGPITGKGFDIGIIDDPLKNAEEAYSERVRENCKEWYDSTFYTRAEPDAAIIIIQTRWHEDDLCGWLLSREEEKPEHWHILHFDALKSSEELQFPKTCTVEYDWRKQGEALCPERFNEEKLRDIQKKIGSIFWTALYQQRPTAMSGDIWRREWFKNTFELSTLLNQNILLDVGYDWDLAYTEDDRNTACCYVKSGRDVKGNIYILDIGFEWYEFPELIKWMISLQGPHFIEAKASGKSAKQTLTRQNIAASEVEVQGGDKISRARLATPMVENGKVFIASHILEKLLEDSKQGLLHFPNGSHNDLNDAFVQSINRHTKQSTQLFFI